MTVYDLDSLTLVPAYWQIAPTQSRPIDVIGIHSAEAAELPSTAEALGAYFNRHPQIVDGTRKASTHLGVDVDSVGFYVPFENIAYAAGGINANGIHIEHAGYARQTRAEWLDDYSEKMLRLSASVTAALCVRYSIPPIWLGPDDLLAKHRGITSHVNACIAFGGDHWDPGYEFPEDLYIKWVRENLEPTPLQKDIDMFLVRVVDDPNYPAGVLLEVSGNGISWVQSGNVVDLYRQAGVETVDSTAAVITEALWTKPGVGPSPATATPPSIVVW